VIVLKGRKPMRDGWRVPTLLIDANLNPELVRPWWPNYRTAANLSVLTPHQRTRQVVDSNRCSVWWCGVSDGASGTDIRVTIASLILNQDFDLNLIFR
jgi:hypothetical protein